MDFDELLAIMSALRGEKGCPWDKEQTPESLKPFLVEETYEVLEAIDDNNPDALKEELGDLLFQIVFQVQMAKERGEFDMADVIGAIGGKMIGRHPHVFADAEYKTPDEVLVHWEAQKKREGKYRESIIDGVPKALPSMQRAHRIQDRAARAGFDWERLDDVLAKVDEELKEFTSAVREKKKNDIESELGDIFFMLINLARFIGINPEEALRKTIGKFISRFRYIEMAAADLGKKLSEMTLAEMDAFWEEAKMKEQSC